MAPVKIIALVGISGVGKSTAARRIGDTFPCVVLSASSLLKTAYLRMGVQQSSEELRIGPVVENQELLVREFWATVADDVRPVIFDGHVLIEGREGLVLLSSEIFRQLRITEFIFLEAPSETIVARRLADRTKTRPVLTTAQAQELQMVCLQRTRALAQELDVPITVLPVDDFAALLEAVRRPSVNN